MAAIQTCIEYEGITQREAAARFNVTQPGISDIYQGKIELLFCRQVDQHAGPGRLACRNFHK